MTTESAVMSGGGEAGAVASERERLVRLHAYQVLDTPPEGEFNDIAALAAELCQTPIALVSFVDADRQWFKARVGLDVCETARSSSFCAHTMQQESVMQVPDALLDPRFAQNPLVLAEPHIRFYAGAPLRSASGASLGSLCVIDRRPRLLSPTQSAGLTTLARHVMVALELRQYRRSVSEVSQRLHDAERIKDEFLARVTHELRTPLTSIHGYLEALDGDDLPPGVTARFLATIRRNSDRLLHLVNDMMLAAELGCNAVQLDRERVSLTELATGAVDRNQGLAVAKDLWIRADALSDVDTIGDRVRLAQAIDRLVLNAIKFTAEGGIVIGTTTHEGQPVLTVTDTGVGIPEEDRDRMFRAFRRSAAAEQAEVQGVGLGLTIVKSIIDGHGGTIGIDSAPGRGTTVTLTLPSV
ncbi:GAF domain-containing sensor histidine kinase [Catenuloplanes indicus]|nr:GAF domain-containing sensor histidine kinase [Catenuloplanes indicus]